MKHLKDFIRDEEGSVVQTVMLAAGGVGLAVAVFGGADPVLGINVTDGTAAGNALSSSVSALGLPGSGL